MSDVAIRVEGLSKQYRIGGPQARYKTLRESLNSAAQAPFRRAGRLLRGEPATDHQETIWALKDVSFEVKHGEVLGIIGRNGAGKSTLLKILSRITAPTEGTVDLYGRVGSLLEVGTGFHPELTGRENIYLNGAILGMKRNEIDRKFDEIVAFAELEKFLDTPVKHYSSGMYVRLAFAVAAHLDPEILLVDEVLAVGDGAFQKKCLGMMGEVAREGRTVLFVSHNMGAVRRICTSGLLLEAASIARTGVVEKVVSTYLNSGLAAPSWRRWQDVRTSPGDHIVRLVEVRVHTEDNQVLDDFDVTRPIGITMDYVVLREGHVFTHSCNLFNDDGVNILNSHDVVSDIRTEPRSAGKYSSTAWIPGNLLSEGKVLVAVAAFQPEPFVIHFYEHEAVMFNVVDRIRGDSARGNYVGGYPGIVRPLLQWTTFKR